MGRAGAKRAEVILFFLEQKQSEVETNSYFYGCLRQNSSGWNPVATYATLHYSKVLQSGSAKRAASRAHDRKACREGIKIPK